MNENLNKTFYYKINQIIKDQGYIFGPSQLSLLLHGPFDRKRISNENHIILKEREISIQRDYKNNIFPKLHQIVRALSNSKASFPSRKLDLEEKVKIITLDEVRTEAKHFFWRYNDFKLDDETANNFFSNRQLKSNKYIQYAFDLKEGFIFALRIKQNPNITEKYKIIFNQLSLEEKDRFFEFILTASEFSRDYWQNDSQNILCQEYGEKLNKLLINDYLGFKIVEFKQKRAEKNLERIASIGPNIDVKGFIGVEKRFNDHRARKIEDRPGGIHLTFVDSGHTNYPLEVQYLDSESFVLDQFGPNSHDFYALRGKKNNYS